MVCAYCGEKIQTEKDYPPTGNTGYYKCFAEALMLQHFELTESEVCDE
jgi:hypothetical protein